MWGVDIQVGGRVVWGLVFLCVGLGGGGNVNEGHCQHLLVS